MSSPQSEKEEKKTADLGRERVENIDSSALLSGLDRQRKRKSPEAPLREKQEGFVSFFFLPFTRRDAASPLEKFNSDG